MKSFRVLSASVNPDTGYIEVVKELTADDNSTSLNLHTFHPEALEWRAAELGLTDVNEVIDGILHEPFFDDVLAFNQSIQDALALFRTRLAAAKAKYADPIPRNALAIKTLLLNAGVAQRYIDAVNGDPVLAIKNACPFDVEVIAVKREHTDKIRNAAAVLKARAVPQKPPTRGERIAKLRAQERIPTSDIPRTVDVPVDEAPLPPIVLGERSGNTKGT